MASEFPEVHFYGVDIAAIYPTEIKPANTFFFQDNILTTTIFDDGMFDYIFVRHLYGCFSVVEWDVRNIQIFKNLNFLTLTICEFLFVSVVDEGHHQVIKTGWVR